jgi:hypothetical protein
MPESYEFWEPNEWEEYACRLLHDRHGPINVMKVPARHKGDFGIDYYCLMHRVAYQCYAVQEPCEVADRADKQKAKITTDLAKFCSRNEIERLFSGTKVSRWILLVPIHDSAQVNLHLTAKTAEVRQKGLSYVADDFEVLIHDFDCFDPASREARAAQRLIVSVPVQQPTQSDIESWAHASNPLVSNLSTKLGKRLGMTGSIQLEQEVQKAIGWFLEKENTLDSVRRVAPQLHEALLAVVTRHLSGLTLSGPPDSASAHQILRSELDNLKAELKAGVPNFSEDGAHRIALGTIVEWLLRCPLDFPPYTRAN